MVRIGFPGGPRLEWYDRNPQYTREGYQASGVAPHPSTERASYTVPTGKKALISMVHLSLIRDAAPTTEALAAAYALLAGIRILEAHSFSSSVGDKDSCSVGQSGTLNAGETLSTRTLDGSTGGSYHYAVCLVCIEFNA